MPRALEWIIRTSAVLAALLAFACSSKDRDRAEESAKSIAQVGVLPWTFQCESVAPFAELATIVGGTVAHLENQFEPQQGVAAPCNFLVTTPAGPQAWTFDLDCRSTAIEQAEVLFAQYQSGNQKRIDGYAAASAADAGVPIKKPVKVAGEPEVDAGPPAAPPEPAVAVEVGKKAFDHHGQSILFVDDDAPCHVRVFGPNAAGRLALARLIAKNLTEANAPMEPRFRRSIPKP